MARSAGDPSTNLGPAMIVAAVAVEYGLACLFYPVLRLGHGVRFLAFSVLTTLVLLAPLLVAEEERFGRFLAALFAVALAVKLFDLHLGAGRGDFPGFRATFAFLINLTSIVLRKLHLEPRPARREDWRRSVAMGLASIPGVALFFGSFRLDWRGVPFAVEHCVKVLLFFLLIVPASSAGAAIWRLLGGRTREPMDNPFASDTPADFWRRHNRPAQQFFLEDVFKPIGGIRRPIRGTMATFLVSGLIHEYLFIISVGRVRGYQVAFFLIQGVAVVLTMGLQPRGWWRALGIASTITFNLATGTLFFASIDEVAPFYARR
jgi:hypothetical protein